MLPMQQQLLCCKLHLSLSDRLSLPPLKLSEDLSQLRQIALWVCEGKFKNGGLGQDSQRSSKFKV